MDLIDINNRIKKEICYDTIFRLSDEMLINEYKETNSVKNEINILGKILDDFVNEEIKQKVIERYLFKLIPAGTKGVIRGNKFNKIVKEYIINLNLDNIRFEICFEKKCESYMTSEIPDWYILEKLTNKILIGMNQLDLISGGHQINRGYKYLIDNKHNSEYSKLLCVICNDFEIKSKKNKAYNLYKIGFDNNTLCYLQNLENIIKNYFIIMD